MDDGQSLPTTLTHAEFSFPASGTDWTVEITDEGGARRLPLTKERSLTIGTDRSADLCVEDPCVSKVHAQIALRDGGIHFRDNRSRNGSFLGGARITEATCPPGAVLVIGRSVLRFFAESLAEGDEDCGKTLPQMAGGSRLMRSVGAKTRKLAKLSAPVLVRGETGTGKELIARALHDLGSRASLPFVPLNVAALPRELVESELFGYERGAFTGAQTRKPGAFAEAGHGTLFLDEIGELPKEAQPKLLRILDGYEYRSLGGQGGVRSHARIVAATHVALDEQVDAGHFRLDLLHRLDVLTIDLPPLRRRPEDIPSISKSLLAQIEREVGPKTLSPRALSQLVTYEWPGNVRELRNVLLRAAHASDAGREIRAEHIASAWPNKPKARTLTLTRDMAHEFLKRHHGNISQAARAAGYPRTSFWKLLQDR